MLKAVAKEVAVPLSTLVNISFREGKFADIYKHSNVIPLTQNGDNSDSSIFLSVSLLSNVGKLQERIFFKHIYNILPENDLLYKYQSGFLPNHSTTFQLIDMYHHICQAFSSNQYSCMDFLDFSKAFDRVWHKELIFKLLKSIDGELLEWISDYLSGKKQNIVIRNTSSSNESRGWGSSRVCSRPSIILVYINNTLLLGYLQMTARCFILQLLLRTSTVLSITIYAFY